MDENPRLAPNVRQAPPAPAWAKEARVAAAATPRRILIGCSDPLLGEALLQVLRHHVEEISTTGLDIRCVMDGVSCLRQVELQRPDLLILNARLDIMSGAEVLSNWKATHPGESLPLLLLSTVFGSDVPSDVPDSDVLQVPCANTVLVERVARVFVVAGHA